MMVGEMGVNCYIPYCEETMKAVVIDPGDNGDKILRLTEKNNVQITMILLTHGHFDHIGSVKEIKERTGALVAIHSEDADMLTNPSKNLSSFVGHESIQSPADILIEDGRELQIGTMKLTAIHTPGHTPGGICYLSDEILFTGDTLFEGSVGRTDLPGGSQHVLMQSINEKLMVLADELKIYPGHGRVSTLGKERETNPFLQDREDFDF
ncbi:MAG: MBL fold metallo-hydrolase [Clostridiales bacterium]|nr:MBL fold metallo-hydrolase [Clostridiales bacterium]